MKILDLLYIICAAVVLLSLAWHTEALAQEHARPGDPGAGVLSHPMPMHNGAGVTPYGDFCPRCSNYGVGQHPVSHKVASEALGEYFHAKGLTVKNVHGRGRFLKADIYKDGRLVDRILFDRRTGRIRSIL
ncbi:hypothetical protein LCGC14_2130690 [marine sediment metagenome]|uniref:PepSY domain-containing protein n=1 Tax=marine sediment metagenome TaxID=412755 RepID=A0A0F9E1H0_9ZZZZ